MNGAIIRDSNMTKDSVSGDRHPASVLEFIIRRNVFNGMFVRRRLNCGEYFSGFWPVSVFGM